MTIYFLYPQDFQLLLDLFGEMFLRGVRKRRPRYGEADHQLACNNVLNRLVCGYTMNEGVEYYRNGCAWPGRDPDCHYVKFVFSGERRLSMMVLYGTFNVSDDLVD